MRQPPGFRPLVVSQSGALRIQLAPVERSEGLNLRCASGMAELPFATKWVVAWLFARRGTRAPEHARHCAEVMKVADYLSDEPCVAATATALAALLLEEGVAVAHAPHSTSGADRPHGRSLELHSRFRSSSVRLTVAAPPAGTAAAAQQPPLPVPPSSPSAGSLEDCASTAKTAVDTLEVVLDLPPKLGVRILRAVGAEQLYLRSRNPSLTWSPTLRTFAMRTFSDVLDLEVPEDLPPWGVAAALESLNQAIDKHDLQASTVSMKHWCAGNLECSGLEATLRRLRSVADLEVSECTFEGPDAQPVLDAIGGMTALQRLEFMQTRTGSSCGPRAWGRRPASASQAAPTAAVEACKEPLWALGFIQGLRELVVEGCSNMWGILDGLRIARLTSLALDGFFKRSDGPAQPTYVKMLRECVQLRSLNLRNNVLTDESSNSLPRVLRALVCVTVLDLGDSKLLGMQTDGFVAALEAMPRLRNLNVLHCETGAEEFMPRVAQRLVDLEELKLGPLPVESVTCFSKDTHSQLTSLHVECPLRPAPSSTGMGCVATLLRNLPALTDLKFQISPSGPDVPTTGAGRLQGGAGVTSRSTRARAEAAAATPRDACCDAGSPSSSTTTPAAAAEAPSQASAHACVPAARETADGARDTESEAAPGAAQGTGGGGAAGEEPGQACHGAAVSAEGLRQAMSGPEAPRLMELDAEGNVDDALQVFKHALHSWARAGRAQAVDLARLLDDVDREAGLRRLSVRWTFPAHTGGSSAMGRASCTGADPDNSEAGAIADGADAGGSSAHKSTSEGESSRTDVLVGAGARAERAAHGAACTDGHNGGGAEGPARGGKRAGSVGAVNDQAEAPCGDGRGPGAAESSVASRGMPSSWAVGGEAGMTVQGDVFVARAMCTFLLLPLRELRLDFVYVDHHTIGLLPRPLWLLTALTSLALQGHSWPGVLVLAAIEGKRRLRELTLDVSALKAPALVCVVRRVRDMRHLRKLQLYGFNGSRAWHALPDTLQRLSALTELVLSSEAAEPASSKHGWRRRHWL